MKIIIIGNVPLPDIAERLGKSTVYGGWLVAISNHLKLLPDKQLVYCFPQNRTMALIDKQINGIHYYGFYENMDDTNCYQEMVDNFTYIFQKELPDVVHIFGTEYAHALAVVKSQIDLDKVVVSVQGLTKIIADHYCTRIPESIANQIYIDGNGNKKSIRLEQEDFYYKAKNEREVFACIRNVEGRTEFDRAFTKLVNKNIRYFHCNRILRDSFYENKWEYEKCEKNTIFLSQASYPVKGLHIFLEALVYVKKYYSNIRVKIAGDNIVAASSDKCSPYGNYIKLLVEQYNLADNIVFLGSLNEKRMCEEYLKANMFVIPSVIENSPNSLVEAMILGVPCIAADVGGVAGMISHNSEGKVYRTDAPYMLAFYIMEYLENPKMAIDMGLAARKRVIKQYSPMSVMKDVISMYEMIGGHCE